MSSTTQPQTFSDLYTALLNAMREDTSGTATTTQAKRYINTALQDMHIGFAESLPWAERQARLTTQAPYSTGTVSISKGSTTLTGSSTAWNTNNSFSVKNTRAYGKIVINGGTDVYEVSSVGGDTSITLSSAWVDTTVSAVTYQYFEDEYDLHADFLRPLDMQFFDSSRDIVLIDRTEFRRRYPRNKVVGKPQVATIIDRPFSANTTPVRRVRIYKPCDQEYTIPYSFITNKLAISSAGAAQAQLSADSDEPIVPHQYRHAIVLHALYNWYRDKKDDARSQEVRSEYTDLILRITGDTEVAARRPKIQPKMGNYRQRARGPYSAGRSGRYTTGSSFDEMR